MIQSDLRKRSEGKIRGGMITQWVNVRATLR